MDPMGRPGSYGDLNAFPTNAASVGEWLDAIGLVRRSREPQPHMELLVWASHPSHSRA